MPWARWVHVALQAGQALEYLHVQCEPQVVHGDFKDSNVLLEAAMDTRLCDLTSGRADRPGEIGVDKEEWRSGPDVR